MPAYGIVIHPLHVDVIDYESLVLADDLIILDLTLYLFFENSAKNNSLRFLVGFFNLPE